MTAVSAEEGSLSSKRSWNLKAETSFIYSNAGNAESAFGRTRQKSATGPLDLNGGPTHDGSGRHAPGLTTAGHPPEWPIQAECDSLAELGACSGLKKSPWEKCGSPALPGSSATAAITSVRISVLIDASRWGDDVRLSDLEPKFTCKVCGHRGADIRPFFDGRRRAPCNQNVTNLRQI